MSEEEEEESNAGCFGLCGTAKEEDKVFLHAPLEEEDIYNALIKEWTFTLTRKLYYSEDRDKIDAMLVSKIAKKTCENLPDPEMLQINAREDDNSQAWQQIEDHLKYCHLEEHHAGDKYLYYQYKGFTYSYNVDQPLETPYDRYVYNNNIYTFGKAYKRAIIDFGKNKVEILRKHTDNVKRLLAEHEARIKKEEEEENERKKQKL